MGWLCCGRLIRRLPRPPSIDYCGSPPPLHHFHRSLWMDYIDFSPVRFPPHLPASHYAPSCSPRSASPVHGKPPPLPPCSLLPHGLRPPPAAPTRHLLRLSSPAPHRGCQVTVGVERLLQEAEELGGLLQGLLLPHRTLTSTQHHPEVACWLHAPSHMAPLSLMGTIHLLSMTSLHPSLPALLTCPPRLAP